MKPEDISEIFGGFYHCKNKKIEHFGESQLKMASSGLIWASCKDFWNYTVSLTICSKEIRYMYLEGSPKYILYKDMYLFSTTVVFLSEFVNTTYSTQYSEIFTNFKQVLNFFLKKSNLFLNHLLQE